MAEGNKVKVFLQLRGREMMFKDKAESVIKRFKDDINAEFEGSISRLGNRFSVLLKKSKQDIPDIGEIL